MGTHYVAVDPGAVNVQYDANGKKWMATTSATKDEWKGGSRIQKGQWDASKS